MQFARQALTFFFLCLGRELDIGLEILLGLR
jgi:hypothetical protein